MLHICLEEERPMKITLKVNGIEKLTEKLKQAAGPAVRKEVAGELYRFAEEVMAASKEIVPVDTGALMNTGKVLLPEETGDMISVTPGYGDEAVGYALYVHENLSPTVNWTRPGSGPKYLENPVKDKQDELPGRLMGAYKKGLNK